MGARANDMDWTGFTVVCMASGPSLTPADVARVRQWRKAGDDRRVIVTNNTYQLAPWADVLYGMDALWWSKYGSLTRAQFNPKGLRVSRPPRHPIHRDLTVLEFHHGGNSGCGAMGLAQHFGASRVILLGYDCQLGTNGKRHWHGDHIKGLGNCMSLPKFPEQFRQMARYLAGCTIEVVNASRETAIECWPRQPLEDALAGLPVEDVAIAPALPRSRSARELKQQRHAMARPVTDLPARPRRQVRQWKTTKPRAALPRATRVCVLRSGGDFGPEHVLQLAEQVPGLVCLSDTEIPGVPTVQLRHDWPGYWAKMELWSGSLMGDLFFFDLDTVIRGDLEALEDATCRTTTLLSDFYYPETPASGLMYIAAADKDAVWNAWKRAPKRHMQAPAGKGVIGDQGFLASRLDPQRWQDIAPGAVVSYKAHCQAGVPRDACVVCFHGKPRPWDPSVSLDVMPAQQGVRV